MEESFVSKKKIWRQTFKTIKTLEGEFRIPVWTQKTDDNPPSLAEKKAPKSHSSKGFKKQFKTRTVVCNFENCNKSFYDRQGLRKHTQLHGPRNFKCDECGKAFYESSKLKRHHLVHTGEKPFTCTFNGCGRKFSLDFNLRTHFRTHTGQKPYLCKFAGCTRTFNQSTNLRSHMKTHLK